MIIQRALLSRVFEALVDSPLVLVEGCPRSGRTVFARQLIRASTGRAVYLDARNPPHGASIPVPAAAKGRAALRPSAHAFTAHQTAAALAAFAGGLRSGALLVIDNADEAPDIVEAARVLAAQAMAGSAISRAPGLPASALRMVLVGISFSSVPGPEDSDVCPGPAAAPGTELRFRLYGLSLAEAGPASLSRHWFRGGFPEAFFAPNDEAASAFLWDSASRLADSSLMRALPAPSTALRLLRMLAAGQGQPLRQSAIAASLGVSRPALARCIAALEAAGIVFFLPAWSSGPCARSRLSPILYFADQGLCHSLLGITSSELSASRQDSSRLWEAYAIGEARKVLPPGIDAAQYRTQDGAGLELLLYHTAPPGRAGAQAEAEPPLLAASIRSPRGSKVSRGALNAVSEIKPLCVFLVQTEAPAGFRAFSSFQSASANTDPYTPNIVSIGLPLFLEKIAAVE